jgi:hypothetical protein
LDEGAPVSEGIDTGVVAGRDAYQEIGMGGGGMGANWLDDLMEL